MSDILSASVEAARKRLAGIYADRDKELAKAQSERDVNEQRRLLYRVHRYYDWRVAEAERSLIELSLMEYRDGVWYLNPIPHDGYCRRVLTDVAPVRR